MNDPMMEAWETVARWEGGQRTLLALRAMATAGAFPAPREDGTPRPMGGLRECNERAGRGTGMTIIGNGAAA